MTPTSRHLASLRLLGLGHDASPTDIRRAYRRWILQLHPDRNANVEAAAQFLEIVEAYAALKRSGYLDGDGRTRPAPVPFQPTPLPHPPMHYRGFRPDFAALTAVAAFMTIVSISFWSYSRVYPFRLEGAASPTWWQLERQENGPRTMTADEAAAKRRRVMAGSFALGVVGAVPVVSAGLLIIYWRGPRRSRFRWPR